MGDKLSSFSRYKSWGVRVCAILIVVLFSQCSSNATYFHQYKSVDIDGWCPEDTVVFHLTPSSVNAVLEAEIGVRTTNAFKYNKLFLKGSLQCEGVETATDTLFIPIYDKNGINMGTGIPYPLCTNTIPAIRLDSGKVYTYTVTPFMKPSKVKGIKDIGLKLMFSEK